MDPTQKFKEAMRPLIAEYGEREWPHGPSPKELFRQVAEAFVEATHNGPGDSGCIDICRAAFVKEVIEDGR